MKNLFINSNFFAPLSYGQRARVMGQPNVASLIARLLTSRRPSAVLRAIAFFVVDAINLVLGRRAVAHVGVEVFKFTPPVADDDSSASVVNIVRGLSVVATTFHVCPNRVFRRSSAAMRNSITLVKSKAAAGFRAAILQFACNHDAALAAITLALPLFFAGGLVGYARDDNQFAETLSAKIKATTILGRHDVFSCAEKALWIGSFVRCKLAFEPFLL